jgi:hypothetical protein
MRVGSEEKLAKGGKRAQRGILLIVEEYIQLPKMIDSSLSKKRTKEEGRRQLIWR